MKRKTLRELEIKIRENTERFYFLAYTAAGNRQGAEALTEKAVLHGAKCYSDLMNKKRFFDIVEEEIGVGSFLGAEPTDTNVLAERIIARVRAWNRRSTFWAWFCGTAVILAALVGSLSLILPKIYEAKSNDVILMKDTLAIGGDFGNSEIVNYHRLSDKVTLGSNVLNETMGRVFLEQIASATTTPRGMTYVAVNNFDTLEADSTFTLYRGLEDGWEAVGTAPIGAGVISYPMNLWQPSEIYTFSDKESNVYVVSRTETEIQIHKYSPKTELMEKMASIPFSKIDHINQVFVEFDPEYGEKGTAYLICKEFWEDTSVLRIFRYDTATDTLSTIMDRMALSSYMDAIHSCVKDDTVYTVVTNSESTVLYQIYSDGFDYKEKLSDARENIADMAVDNEGNVHVLTRNFRQYIVSSESLLFKADQVQQLYYQDTDYIRSDGNIFIGDDGELYYIEAYSDGSLGESCFLALGKLDHKDPAKSTYVNGFDLPDIISWVRMEGRSVMLLTSEFMGDGYIVYFYINMLGEEE